MKALLLKEANSPFVMEEVPDPVAGPGEAVARVHACGSGLTIQHIKAGRMNVDFPRIIGHEITGEIVEVGAGVTNVAVGDPVTAYFYMTCGHCKWCLSDRETLCENLGGYVGREIDGGYAEYMKLPASTFLKLPDGLDWKNHPAEIGVITDALATPVKVVRRADIKPKDTVAVFGAGGGLGIHMLMMAKWANARVIAVDTKTEKFDACRTAGADEVVDASQGNVVEALMDLTDGKGIDAAIDFVSVPETLEAGAEALAMGGRLLTLGGGTRGTFQVSQSMMLQKEAQLMGSRYATKSEVMEALELVARGEVWPMVSEIRSWNQAEEVHERIEQGLVTGRAALLID